MNEGRSNRVCVDGVLESYRAGTHEIQYDIYSHGMLLTGGRAAIEIGPGKIVSVNTSPHEMDSGQTQIYADIELYGYGSGRLELKLDNETVETHTIELSGFGKRNFQIELDRLPEGMHSIQANMYFTDSVSTKSDWFRVRGEDELDRPDADITLSDTKPDETGSDTPSMLVMVLIRALTGLAGRIVQ